jgi:hypothetical protein
LTGQILSFPKASFLEKGLHPSARALWAHWSIADFRCPQTAKEDGICFFAGFAGEKTLLGNLLCPKGAANSRNPPLFQGGKAPLEKSENHKSLPVSRKAFVVSNNGRIYIGRGVG